MRVMKQQAVIALDSMVRADSPDQGRVIPFVNDDEIDPIERAIQIESCRIVKGAAQAGIDLSRMPRPALGRALAINLYDSIRRPVQRSAAYGRAAEPPRRHRARSARCRDSSPTPANE